VCVCVCEREREREREREIERARESVYACMPCMHVPYIYTYELYVYVAS
jgi:hypothetical protein